MSECKDYTCKQLRSRIRVTNIKTPEYKGTSRRTWNILQNLF